MSAYFLRVNQFSIFGYSYHRRISVDETKLEHLEQVVQSHADSKEVTFGA